MATRAMSGPRFLGLKNYKLKGQAKAWDMARRAKDVAFPLLGECPKSYNYI